MIVPYHQGERVADDSLPMVTADTRLELSGYRPVLNGPRS